MTSFASEIGSETRRTTRQGRKRGAHMDVERGIYIYGFGLSRDSDIILKQKGDEIAAIVSGEIVAFARTVDLAQYSEDALKERANDQEWLISEAQHHHQIITDIHRTAPILPGKFGSAYATEDDVREAIDRSRASIIERLDSVQGCDEWAVHVYLEDVDLTQAVLENDPELARLADQLSEASEGRNYMLRQRIQSRLRDAIEQYELELADAALDELRSFAVEVQYESPREPEAVPDGETEIARASMLVPRDRAEDFIEQAELTNRTAVEIWLQITGPWPAYSFAQVENEEERVIHE